MPKQRQRRLPSEGRKFGSMRILDDGRVRYSAWTVSGLQPLVVFAHYRCVGLDDEDIDNTSTYSVMLSWAERPIFLISVRQHRVESTQFTYNLTPEELRHAVSVVRHMKNGLEKWIIPGLARMEWGLWEKPQNPKAKATLATIPSLLRSVRSLPIARRWRSEQKAWERWRRSRKR